jgi:hypothetical protein
MASVPRRRRAALAAGWQGAVLFVRGRKNDGRAREIGKQLRSWASPRIVSDAHTTTNFCARCLFLRRHRRWPKISDQHKSGHPEGSAFVRHSELVVRNGEVTAGLVVSENAPCGDSRPRLAGHERSRSVERRSTAPSSEPANSNATNRPSGRESSLQPVICFPVRPHLIITSGQQSGGSFDILAP